MLVRASILPDCPKAFQDFVASCFAEQQIGDEKYFYAFRSIKFRSGGNRGQASAFSLDIEHFREGLANGEDLGRWINGYLKKNPNDHNIISFYTHISHSPADSVD